MPVHQFDLGQFQCYVLEDNSKITVLTVADIFADVMQKLIENESISSHFIAI